MSLYPFALVRRLFGWVWRVLDACRRFVLNLAFLALLGLLVVMIFIAGRDRLGDQTVLVFNISGHLVEQHAGGVRRTALDQALGEHRKDTQLRDVLVVLEAAAKDPKINSVLLLLDDFSGTGQPLLREVSAALARFKASGKPVLAWGSSYDQRQYYLAAQADQVFLDPMGVVMLEGFGRQRNYYRDALDKLGITVNLLKVGTFKSFGEPYVTNQPSSASIEAESYLYNALWASYTEGVERARKMPAGAIMQGINDLPQLLRAADGDIAKMALSIKLVDALKTRDELRQMLIKSGARDEQNKSFRQIAFNDYLARQKPKTGGDAVGVVVAQGEISNGKAPAGSVGGLSTANLIRKAREDEQIKAIVLRVDSPGGAVFGSELIRRELELARNAGKPVVVSMGNVAASGGYWISMAADEIMADVTTITGSIGVLALLPTADKAMEKIGIHSGGVSTTWLAGGYGPMRPLDPRFADLIQSAINHIYADFTVRAAQARKTTPQKIDDVAQGRVWTGQQARERGLIDTVGSYGDALNSAAARAKLGSNYRVSYIEREASGFERIVSLFDVRLSALLAEQFDLKSMHAGIPLPAVAQMARELGWLAELADGRKGFVAVAHCLCGDY